MSRCETIRKRKRTVCSGDMRDPITLHVRDLTSPLFNTVDFNEDFQPLPVNPQILSMVETVSGKNYFDGVGIETPITHHIYIRFREDVTAQTWVELNTRRLDILDTEDLEERHEFLKLVCTDRGLNSREASKA